MRGKSSGDHGMTRHALAFMVVATVGVFAFVAATEGAVLAAEVVVARHSI